MQYNVSLMVNHLQATVPPDLQATVPPDLSQLSYALVFVFSLQTAIFGFIYPPVFNFSSPLHRKC